MAIETPALAKPVDLGQTFLAWLKQGLVSGELPMNTVNARVHHVREGLLLVIPGGKEERAGVNGSGKGSKGYVGMVLQW
jgi:hypothetical protein